SGGMSPQRHKGTKKGRDSLCNKDVTSCFFDKVFGTLTRRFAAPSPGGRGTFCRRVLLPLGEGFLLPLGEGGPKGRMRALNSGTNSGTVSNFFVSKLMFLNRRDEEIAHCRISEFEAQSAAKSKTR